MNEGDQDLFQVTLGRAKETVGNDRIDGLILTNNQTGTIVNPKENHQALEADMKNTETKSITEERKDVATGASLLLGEVLLIALADPTLHLGVHLTKKKTTTIPQVNLKVLKEIFQIRRRNQMLDILIIVKIKY